ncbi:histidine phosphatase family protein [Tahibacter soli]|jgi:broad specificity phosphatase PhoE|uniref:Alpha-ribazole phosphatase family protein n=1 Tax=Tahibacter soli TaxID=2983605 RepID=A0A9X3YI36_9GAMM|nr:alpha-ribazole phosphatase family protein [Tahibacter soli]MDC8011495.1 alpha-ribazole phosphatase family protein [Tahibacter soli]
MELILVRHGDVEAAPGLCIGCTDVALSATGFTAIQRLAAQWIGRVPRFLFSSDLRRAQQSAQVFAARFATEPLADPRLREVDLGEWDGRHWDEIARTDAARYRHWADNWVIQEAPGGESFADVVRRTGAWLSALLSSTNDDDVVLAIAHAGSIRALLCHALGLPPARAFALRIGHAQASAVVCRNGQFEVSYLNASRFEAM